jgi:WD40 repeat protein
MEGAEGAYKRRRVVSQDSARTSGHASEIVSITEEEDKNDETRFYSGTTEIEQKISLNEEDVNYVNIGTAQIVGSDSETVPLEDGTNYYDDSAYSAPTFEDASTFEDPYLVTPKVVDFYIDWSWGEAKLEQIVQAKKVFQEDSKIRNNFLKHAKWSPDATCILTNSEDNILRLFEIPTNIQERMTKAQSSKPDDAETTDAGMAIEEEMEAVLGVGHGGTVYDFGWYPHMNSNDPATCCFASTSCDHPVHLWDAFTGKQRATYRAYNQMDEIVAAISLAFSPGGDKIFCGYNNAIRIFSTAVPGRQFQTINTKQLGFRGIISCLAFSNGGGRGGDGLLVAGSYTRQTSLALFDAHNGHLVNVLENAHFGGVTQVQFSGNGIHFFSGARKDGDIIGWDARYLGAEMFRMKRKVNTNQHIHFDLDPTAKFLVTPSQDQKILIYSAEDGSLITEYPTSPYNINTVSLHPWLPVIATASGQRKYFLSFENDMKTGNTAEESNKNKHNNYNKNKNKKQDVVATSRTKGKEKELDNQVEFQSVETSEELPQEEKNKNRDFGNGLMIWTLKKQWQQNQENHQNQEGTIEVVKVGQSLDLGPSSLLVPTQGSKLLNTVDRDQDTDTTNENNNSFTKGATITTTTT